MRKPAGIWERLRIWLGVALSLAAVLGMAIGLLGIVWVPGDAANIVAPLWPVLGLAGALCLAHRARRAALAIGLLALCYGAVILAPGLRPAPAAGVGSVAHDLRIVQFNVWKNNADPEGAARWILGQQPDLVLLAEVAPGSRLLQLLGPSFPQRINCTAHQTCSTWLLSRLPVRRARGLAAGDSQNRRALSAAWGRVITGCGDLDVIAVHLAQPWPYSGQDRDLKLLRAEVARLPRGTLLLAGDFNLPAWQWGMRRLEAQLAPMRRVTQLGVTWPVWLGNVATQPVLPLDHLFLGPRWRVVSTHRGPRLGSDHLPIVTTIRPQFPCELPVTHP